MSQGEDGGRMSNGQDGRVAALYPTMLSCER